MDLSDQELKFPCQYPIKVIGYAKDSFKKDILKVIHHHFQNNVTDDLISFKHSKNHKYLSITINFEAKSREHVDQIYEDLRECPGIISLM